MADSDWVLDTSEETGNSNAKNSNLGDWELALEESSSKPEKESLGYSALAAIPRIGSDIAQGAFNLARQVPSMYRSATAGVPNAINAIEQNPKNAGQQALAGMAQLGQSAFNAPHNALNYLTQRLHLFPEDINQKIQMGRMPEDTQGMINKAFGEPKNSGEEFIRNAPSNVFNTLGGIGIAKTLNPMQLTNKGIAKKVVNELNNQVDKHSDMYNKLWSQADKKGFNQVPFDAKALNSDMSVIKKYYPEKSYKTVNNLLSSPTLENAQRAQSDLGQLRRALEEKAKTTPLLGEEKNIYESISRAEKNIEGSMFKNANGDLHNGLANKYRKITNSYRENVVPYRYNPAIQDYLSKDITAKQLVQSLNQGPFAAKKGGFTTHPQFGIRNALLPVVSGLGLLGGGTYLYDKAMGNSLSQRP